MPVVNAKRFLPLVVLAVVAAVSSCGGVSSGPAADIGAAPALNEGRRVDAASTEVNGAPQNAAAYVRLASADINNARRTGRFDLNAEARKAIEKALEISPRDVDARRLKASLHLTFHEFNEGAKLGEELYAEMPGDSFVLGVLTDAYTEIGNYTKGVYFGQKMVDAKPNSQSYARVAHLRWLHGDHPGAVEMYKLAAQTADPADKEAKSWCLTQLGDELMRSGKYREADKVYAEAVSILPDYPLAMFGQGRAKAALGDLRAAIPLMSGAVERSPHTGNMLEFGDVLRRSGNAAAAERIYLLADNADLLGDTHDAHRMALFWADNDLNLEKALAIAEADFAAIKDIYASDILAWCLYKNGRYAEALEKSREAMRIGTKDAVLFYHAGMIEKALGNRAEAKRLLKTALDINPAFNLVQASIAKTTLAEVN